MEYGKHMLDPSPYDDEVRALIARAVEIAHQGKSYKCESSHLVCAYVERCAPAGEPGKKALAVRVACRLSTAALVRKEEEPPPLAPALVEALARCAEGGPVTRERLLALLCASD